MPIETTYFQRDALGYAKITRAAESAIKATSVTVGTTATPLPATALANRRRLYIKNVDSAGFYIGASADVPGFNGSSFPVRQNEEIVIDVAEALTIFARVESGTAIAKVLEVA
jgi:hypothetical protein